MQSSLHPPGSEGLPVIGESLHFFRDMLGFVRTRIAQHGTFFRTHLLGKTTIVAASYDKVSQMLSQARPFSAHSAYAEFLSIVYPSGNLLLSADDNDSRKNSEAFLHNALQIHLGKYQTPVSYAIRECGKKLAQTKQSELTLYAACKSLAAEGLRVAIFGSALCQDDAHLLRTLASEHLNGIVTTSLSLRARRRAINAHEKLASFIRAQILSNGHGRSDKQQIFCVIDVARAMVENGSLNLEDAVNSIVVLSSAIVVKAVASAAASTIGFLAQDENLWTNIRNDLDADRIERDNDGVLDQAIVESLRLMPPIAGVVRVFTKDDGSCNNNNNAEEDRHVYALNDGWRVWGSVLDANRDAAIYDNPNEFQLARWNISYHSDRDKSSSCPFAWAGEEAAEEVRSPLTFGSGKRRCKGRELAWFMLRETVATLMVNFDVSNDVTQPVGLPSQASNVVTAPPDHKLRVFPVLRTSNDTRIRCRIYERERHDVKS